MHNLPYSAPTMVHIHEPIVVERADTRTHITAPSLKRLGYSRKQREVILAEKLELRAQRSS